MEISTATSLDKPFIFELYQKAFPSEERKPFSLIERKAAMGYMEILVLKEYGKRCGFAITAFGQEIVLLDYFAIAEEYRGEGLGSDALLLLRELYRDNQFFLEIEELDSSQPNALERIRRKNFYLRNGMIETGIHVSLFNVKLELLASRPGLRYEACEEVYREMLGAAYRNMVKKL
ncbi:MAG: GNAT family N-acetyltransferase [Lachnospiraceae bacterium]|jgi:GNAT superfamily N-acetyltransferase|nr:GNAT family N-acetyltransferase [Lachnospiraceae bacterium]RKJ51556.1 N-acetyltransferase [bacterium 1XD42-54]